MSHTEVYTIRKGQKEYFMMHVWLKNNLDIMKDNIPKDHNFNILGSGNGKTRTGKTTIFCQIAAYLDPGFPDNWRNQVVYDWEKLITVAETLKPGQVLLYDEARKVLNSVKSMTNYCQALLDFISEIGDRNLFLIVVLPDFFDLPKSLALVQSHCLINVYYRDFQRGYFDFFNDDAKRNLYIKGKPWRDYHASPPIFKGTFTKYFPIDLEEYKKHKHDELKRLRSIKKERPLSERTREYLEVIKKLIDYLRKKCKLTQYEIAEIAGKRQQTISAYLRDMNTTEINKKDYNTDFEELEDE